MIITEKKPGGELLAILEGCPSVFLVGCGECSTTCKTGGEPELRQLREFLETNGKTVTGACMPKAPCVVSQSKGELARHLHDARRAEAVVVAACGLGVQAFRDAVRWGGRIVPALNTLCGAVVDTQGNFHERCSLCGDCGLAETAALCPTTLCAKGLLNGPCGGMKRGKCEVDSERDCAWVTIYRELSTQQNVGAMRRIKPPKNNAKAARPHLVRPCA